MPVHTESQLRGRATNSPLGLDPRSQVVDYFQALPSETRNQVYNYIFPPNTRFETSQPATDSIPEISCIHDKSHEHRTHPVVIDGIQIKSFLDLLGTCRSIREEVMRVVKKHLRGTFKVVAPTELQRTPQVVLELIDRVTFSPLVSICDRVRYIARFPNANTTVKDALVLSNTKVLQDLPGGTHGNVGLGAIDDLLKTHFTSWTSPDIYGSWNLDG